MRFLKELGRKIAAVTQEPRAGYYLRQRLSVAIVRGNATAVLGVIEKDSSSSLVVACLPYCVVLLNESI